MHEDSGRLAPTFEDAPVAMARLDPSGRFLDVNEKLAELLRSSREELLSRNLSEMSFVQNHAVMMELLKLFREGEVSNYVRKWRYQRKDGTSIWVKVHVKASRRPGETPSFVIVADDITHDVREENLAFVNDVVSALTSSLDYRVALKQFTRRCLPRLGDLCVVDVVQGEQIERVAGAHVNPEFEKGVDYFLSRYPLRTSKPHPSLDVIRTGKPKLYSQLPKDFVEKISYDAEYRNCLHSFGLKSGMVVPISCGQIVQGAITFYSTDSNRSFDEKDLELAQELAWRVGLALENAMLYTQAREEVSLRENLMSVVSHDLKNPLLSIRLNTQLIDRAAESTTDSVFLKGAANRIRQTSLQMERLIDDLLDVSRMESHGLAIEPMECELQPLIEEAVEVFRPIAQDKSIQLELDCPAQMSCACDPERIIQVLSNLLGNALKFSPAGKSVRLSVCKQNEEILISVSDEGPGIPADHLHRVFERYWQAPQVKRQGIGLGLHIAKGIVEAHQGRIWAENRGVGSLFQFTLPLGTVGGKIFA